jgi:hypothetical protein
MQGRELDADGKVEVHATDDKEWAAKCVEGALASHHVAPDVARALIEQLEGVAGERALRTSEFAALARELLATSSGPIDNEPTP